MRPPRSVALLMSGAVATAALSGCDYDGLNSLTLPGDKGTGAHSMTVKVDFSDTQGLVPNSPVLVGDLNVGTVRKISLAGDTPVVTVSLKDGLKLPANSVARIGQTSLLGAKHVEIDPPAGEAPLGRLRNGDRIDEAHSVTYPSTEEVLAGVSTLLNGGGLQQIKTITTEVNRMFGGQETTVRSLLANARTLTAALDGQKTSISRAIDSMDVLARRVRDGNGTIDKALRDLPPALKVVRHERVRLVRALESLGRFGGQTQRFLREGGGRNLVTNIRALVPTLRGLADAGSSLVNALWVIPGVLFPLNNWGEYFRGDYVNLWATVDARIANLAHGLLGGTPLDGLLGTPNMLLGKPLGTSNQAANPLNAPVAPSASSTSGPAGGSSPATGTKRSAPSAAATPSDKPTTKSGLAGLLSRRGGAK